MSKFVSISVPVAANRLSSSALAIFATAALAITIGCGLGAPATTNIAAPQKVAINGTLKGGESPISGSSVSIYETATITPGSTGTTTGGVYTPNTNNTFVPIATTQTDSNGNFAFTANSVACTSSTDFLYAVAAGGNTGGSSNGNNPDSLLMAQVGACSNIGSSFTVTINELTTVAAAYALGRFTSVAGTYTTNNNSTASVTAYTIDNSHLATFTANNTYPAGEQVVFSGFTSADGTQSFNGNTFTVYNPTSTTFQVKNVTPPATTGTVTDAGTATPLADAVTSYSVSGGVASVVAPNTLKSGQQVALSGFQTSPGTGFNGNTYTVISATASSFTFKFSTNQGISQSEPTALATEIDVLSVPSVTVTSSITNYIGASNGSSYSPSTTSPAGLLHAFLNAGLLVSPGGSIANSTVPGNTGTVVPAALINTLGNALQSCVNSLGTTGSNSSTTNDGSNCGKLFEYSAIPTGYTGAGTIATNTLQAILNISHYPAQVAVQSIYGMGSGTGAAFQPTLSSSTGLNDLSIAIAYLKGDGAGTNQGLAGPYYLALDAADNVYVTNSGASPYPTNVVALNSAGGVLYASTVDPVVTNSKVIAVDGVGNLFVNQEATAAASDFVQEYSASTGALEQSIATGLAYQWSLALDSSNNLFLGVSISSQNIYEYTRSGTGAGTFTKATFAGTPKDYDAYGTTIDASGNIWLSAYSTSSVETPGILSTPYSGSELTATAAIKGNYNIAIDSSGNGWAASFTSTAGSDSLYKLTPTFTSGTSGAISSFTIGTAIQFGSGSSNRYVNMDGNNTVWGVDATTNFVTGYPTTAATPAAFSLFPCILATAGACPTASATGVPIDGPRVVVPDSTGTLWVASDSNGEIIQIIGAAAPSFPLLSALKPGLIP